MSHFTPKRLTTDVPDAFYACTMAHRFLMEYGVAWLPVNPYEIIYKTPNWKFKYVPQLAYELSRPESYVLERIMCGQDSLTVYDVGQNHYGIILNPSGSSESRRWPVMREIGHIYLNHLSHFIQTGVTLTPQEYDQLNLEADLFAAEVLAPKWLMSHLGIDNEADILLLAGISDPAVRRCYQRATTDYNFVPADGAVILDRFQGYIKEVTYCAPYGWFDMPRFISQNEPRSLFKTPLSSAPKEICRCCGNRLGITEQANFCLACGSPLNPSAVRQAKNCGHVHLKEAAFCVNCGNRVYRVRQGFCLEECEI